MNIDDALKVLAVALVLAHVVVLIAVLRNRTHMNWVVWLNLLVSAGVMAYWVPRFSELFGYIDMVMAFVVFELMVLVVSTLAALRVRMPRAIHWTAFAANALLSANALVFMLTFHITRLM